MTSLHIMFSPNSDKVRDMGLFKGYDQMVWFHLKDQKICDKIGDFTTNVQTSGFQINSGYRPGLFDLDIDSKKFLEGDLKTSVQ